MNFASPNVNSEDGELYEPHEVYRNTDGTSSTISGKEPRLLTGKEKI